MCQSVTGYDANSLYPWALQQLQPAGWPIIYRPCRNNSRIWLGTRTDQSSFAAAEWFAYLRRLPTSPDDILTAETGGEVLVGEIYQYCDGYSASTRTVYEFQGCWVSLFHCHCPR